MTVQVSDETGTRLRIFHYVGNPGNPGTQPEFRPGSQGTPSQKQKTPRIWPTIFWVNPSVFIFYLPNFYFILFFTLGRDGEGMVTLVAPWLRPGGNGRRSRTLEGAERLLRGFQREDFVVRPTSKSWPELHYMTPF